MTASPQFPANIDAAGTVDELHDFLRAIADGIRTQVNASSVLATPRLTSVR